MNREVLQLLKPIFRDEEAQKQKGLLKTQVRVDSLVKRPGVHSRVQGIHPWLLQCL